MTTKKSYIPIIAILILAAALRLGAALIYGDMWADELFHVVYSQESNWTQFWYLMTLETNPPLYTLFLKFWLSIFPATELSFRMTNVVLGTGSVFALYIFAKKLFNKKIALISALVLALYPYHLFMSATIRTYVLLIFLTILSSYYFYTYFIEKNTQKKYLLLYILTTTLLLYSHLTALGVIVTHVIILLYTKQTLKQWFLYMLIPLSAYSTWFIPSMSFKFSASFGTSWFFLLNDFDHFFYLMQSLFTGPTHIIHTILTISLFFVGLIYVIYKKNSDKNFILITLFFFIPFVIALGMQLFNIKFFAITIPWIALLSGYMLGQIKPYYRTILITLICIPAIIPFFTSYFPLHSWDSINEYIKNNTHDKKQIILNDDLSMMHEIDYYYTGHIPVLHFYTINQYATLDEKYIRENYFVYIRPTSEIQTWIQQNNLNKYDELFILQTKPEQIHLDEMLHDLGWKTHDIFNTDLFADTKIIYMKKTLSVNQDYQ